MNIQIPVQQSGNSILRLEFRKVKDRWAHSWSIEGQDRTKTLLRSVEGTPDDGYPASPPVQDINKHSLPAGDALLSVGMAGHGHWSTSFSVEENEGRPYIKADLACLLKKTDCSEKWIGSTYDVGKLVNAQAIEDGVRLVVSWAEIDLIADPKYVSVELVGSQIVVTPATFSERKNEATRWWFSIGGAARVSED